MLTCWQQNAYRPALMLPLKHKVYILKHRRVPINVWKVLSGKHAPLPSRSLLNWVEGSKTSTA